MIEALGALEPVWDQLPAAPARILRLLIERIAVAPDGISVTLQAATIRSLVAELAGEKAEAASETNTDSAAFSLTWVVKYAGRRPLQKNSRH